MDCKNKSETYSNYSRKISIEYENKSFYGRKLPFEILPRFSRKDSDLELMGLLDYRK